MKFELPEVEYYPPEPSKKRSIGLIGCGDVTSAHLTAYKQEGYNVVAFCDVDLERARTQRDAFYPDAAVFEDHTELLGRDDVAVVDIATPPGPRAGLIEDAIRSGTHVLSQKPFVLDVERGRELATLADEYGVRLAVNQNGRWAPHWSYLRGAVDAGLLGNMTGLHLSVHWNHDIPKLNRHDLLFDFGIHWFDLVATLFDDDPRRVIATSAPTPSRTEGNKQSQVLIEFPDAQASIVFDANTHHGISSRTYAVGTKGSLEARGPAAPWSDETPGEKRWPWDDQQIELFTAGGSAMPDLRGSWNPQGWMGAMGELQSAVEDGRQPDNSGHDNLASLKLCFAAVESADSGEPVTVGEVTELPE